MALLAWLNRLVGNLPDETGPFAFQTLWSNQAPVPVPVPVPIPVRVRVHYVAIRARRHRRALRQPAPVQMSRRPNPIRKNGDDSSAASRLFLRGVERSPREAEGVHAGIRTSRRDGRRDVVN